MAIKTKSNAITTIIAITAVFAFLSPSPAFSSSSNEGEGAFILKSRIVPPNPLAKAPFSYASCYLLAKSSSDSP